MSVTEITSNNASSIYPTASFLDQYRNSNIGKSTANQTNQQDSLKLSAVKSDSETESYYFVKAQFDKSKNQNNSVASKNSNRNKVSSSKKDKNITIGGKKELTKGQKQLVKELAKRDKEVREHEAAHQAAGGALVKGAASFTYTVGPDGQQYAIGGEVKIDMSVDGSNPQETINKMETVKRAALAPSEPSSQDRSVASDAEKIEQEAQEELKQEQGTQSDKGKSQKADNNEFKHTIDINYNTGITDNIVATELKSKYSQYELKQDNMLNNRARLSNIYV